jgi:hypothetical protein
VSQQPQPSPAQPTSVSFVIAAEAHWRWFDQKHLGAAIEDVLHEMKRSLEKHPSYTDSPLRRAALVAEESGEALKEALDLTRGAARGEGVTAVAAMLYRGRLYQELTECASMALKAMAAMQCEHAEEMQNWQATRRG